MRSESICIRGHCYLSCTEKDERANTSLLEPGGASARGGAGGAVDGCDAREFQVTGICPQNRKK